MQDLLPKVTALMNKSDAAVTNAADPENAARMAL